MKVAVLMSAYNGELYIRQQIDSILYQKTSHSIELIVRDDGSSDTTKDILNEYQANHKLQWYTGENLKPAKSFMDLLFSCGEYDYYCFADQDDYWFDNKIESAVNSMISTQKPALYFSNTELVDSDLHELNVKLYHEPPKTDLYSIMCASNVIGCTMVMNKQLVDFLRKHEFPKTIAMHDSFIARVCRAIGGEIVYDEVPRMYYRQHANNVLGVKPGIKDKLISRVQYISTKSKVTIDDQAKEILRLYSDDMSNDNALWIKKVSLYRSSLYRRVALAISPKPQFASTNMNITMRLAILTGNR